MIGERKFDGKRSKPQKITEENSFDLGDVELNGEMKGKGIS